MIIETLTEWNAVLIGCGCCPMPACVLPDMECQGLRGSATTSHNNKNEEDTTFARYGKYEYRKTHTISGSGDEFEYYDLTIAGTVQSGFAEYSETLEWDRLFSWMLLDCAVGESLSPEPGCSSSGNLSIDSFDGTGSPPTPANPDPEVPVQQYLAATNVTVRTHVGGTETDEHAAWRALFPNPGDFEAAVAAYDAYVIALAEWENGGSVGDPPPEVFPPDEEPPENYGDCVWRDTYTQQLYDRHGPVLDPVIVITYAFGSDVNPIATYGSVLIEHPTVVTDEIFWTLPVGYAAMVAAMREKLVLETGDFAAREGCYDPECHSSYEVAPEDGNNNIFVNLITRRFRWVLPADYSGAYFKRTWDILDEPDGWDATVNDPDAELPEELPPGMTEEEWWADHQVSDPAAPDRTFFLRDQVWEWTRPLDPGPWYSPWFVIPPPVLPGRRRVVNRRRECWRSARFGVKPEVDGEGVELPDP